MLSTIWIRSGINDWCMIHVADSQLRICRWDSMAAAYQEGDELDPDNPAPACGRTVGRRHNDDYYEDA